ncbi:tyrosine-type recombinase/integrase [Sphingomonas sp. PAMC 26605]|uniref:tyrosine-type recombinase/integrase n=1 Tax=Sphingomonas sp. PAMC 26605 TaxID=1112214 RepID=UPI00026CD5FA
MGDSSLDPAFQELRRWNEGRVLGAQRALKPQQVWAIRYWLDQHRRLRDRALFDFAIDSKPRGCDVVKIRIGDIVAGGRIRGRAIVIQQKTKRPVQFEIVEPARKTLFAWLARRGGTLNDFVFPSRNDYMGHMSTRQYARLVREWIVGSAAELGVFRIRSIFPSNRSGSRLTKPSRFGIFSFGTLSASSRVPGGTIPSTDRRYATSP